MPGESSPISASRFTISIDGVQVGCFDELAVGDAAGSPGRNVQAHELAHVVQQQQAARRLPGRTKYSNITLKRGYISQSAVLSLKVAGGRRVSIAAGTPGARVTLLGARIERSRGQAKGTDVAMEELVLAHEGFG